MKIVVGILIGVIITIFIGFVAPSIIPRTGIPEPINTDTQTPETAKTHVYIDGRIVVGGDGQPIELMNNPNATNPTYAELVAFLEIDQTDKYSYILGPPKVAYVCADFAKDLHNNAETAGIRTAFVGIEIEGQTDWHALNAFQTTDIGLVYIDCTGKGLWDESPNDRSSWDRRARVGIGEEYSVAHIDKARNTTRFLFSVSVEDYRAWGIESFDVLEWLRRHDIEELGQKWMQDWMKEHETELRRCGRELEPKSYHSSRSSFGSESYFTAWGWRVPVDSVDVPWFQPREQVMQIDGMPVVMKVSWEVWERSWLKPLGVVASIHVHW